MKTVMVDTRPVNDGTLSMIRYAWGLWLQSRRLAFREKNELGAGCQSVRQEQGMALFLLHGDVTLVLSENRLCSRDRCIWINLAMMSRSSDPAKLSIPAVSKTGNDWWIHVHYPWE